MYLAMHERSWPIQTREIAANEGIPESFLEQVLASLRRNGIVRSIRGASGGYELGRTSMSITAGDVIRALTGPIARIPCEEDTSSERCDKTDVCVVIGLWKKIQSAMSVILDGTTIQDMIDEREIKASDSGFMMNI